MNKEEIRGMLHFDLQKAMESEEVSRDEGSDDTVLIWYESRIFTLQMVLKYFEGV